MNKQKTKAQKGITLVALIITIIVLLILAVVSIKAVTGDGIISHAKNARTEYGKAQTDEQDMLSKYEYEIAKAQIISKHSLGTAINTDNYGKKVVGYTSKGEGLDTLVWRVFYQDDKNTYLISETSDAKLPVTGLSLDGDKVSKYKSGADVSAYGQALMPKASSLFIESNTNENIIATAYLCDTEVWDAYTDAEGKASYAIGSPTIELFAASYNASNLGNTIELGTNTYGYTKNTELNFSSNQKNGIYWLNASSSSGFTWIASPSASANYICINHGTPGSAPSSATINDTRPVVSIPTSDFQSSYTLAD